jgi:hypothetical protein
MGLTRSLWIAVMVGVLAIVGLSVPAILHFHARIVAIEAIVSKGGGVGTVRHRPLWQRTSLGYPRYIAFEEVEFVNWEGKAITDADLDPLLTFRTIQRLNLRHTRVTDAGMNRLKELPDLKLVLLNGTAVSGAGIAELQRALPGLKIEN